MVFSLIMGGKRHQFATLLMNETWLKMVNVIMVNVMVNVNFFFFAMQ